MSPVLTPFAYVLAFVAVVLFAQTIAELIFAGGDRKRRVNRRLTLHDAGKSREEVFAALAHAPAGTGFDLLRLTALRNRLITYCRQAGVTMSPERVLATTLAVAAALWFAALLVAGRSQAGSIFLVSGAVSLIAALTLSFMGAWLWLRRLRNRRLKRIEEQLPVALDIVIRAIRAGHPVVSAIQLAADEMGDPLGSEFGLIVDETTYGVEFEQALTNFALRTGSPDAHFFAVSVSVQADTGGNLAEILQGLGTVIRGRTTLGKRVRSLASEGRASALVISAMPIFVVAVQLLVSPRIYIEKSADPIFFPVIAITAFVYLIGWVVVHRIINFKY